MTHIFISCSGADLRWAKWGQRTLEQGGCHVTCQFDDCNHGDSFERRNHNAMRD